MWSWVGLAIVLFAAQAVVASPVVAATRLASSAVAMPGSAHAALARGDAAAPLVEHRDGDGRGSIPDLGAVESESSDEDVQSGWPASVAATVLVGTPGRACSICAGASVDTGVRLVYTGLARGPPAAR